MAQALPKRSEVAQELTWDLSKLFINDEACRQALQDVKAQAKDFRKLYKGEIEEGKAKLIVQALKAYDKLETRLTQIGIYAHLRPSTDMADAAAQRLAGEVFQGLAELSADLQFFQDELAKAPGDKLMKAAEEAPQFAIYLKDIQAWQKHMLSPKTEMALAKLGPTLGLPEDVYDISKGGDMRFPDFEVDGKTYPLSYVLYESHYCEEPNTAVRRAAFQAFSDHLKHYHHINATIYNAQVQKEKTISELRGFKSVFDYLLFHQKVDREQYDRHLDFTMEHLAPIMRRWAKLLQKKHGLDEMHYADLKLVLDPDNSPAVSVEEAQDYIKRAIAPMGKDYQDMVMAGFAERWVDFARNEGKSTGGFCYPPVSCPPYILLNWNDSFSELYTLAHELGHAAQGLLTERHNSMLEADFTWYDVESPSTFHEMLLSYSLLQEAEAKGDEALAKRTYAAMIENTYYHNFVTHFLEGYYQREVYRRVDKGENLQAEDFDQIFRETLEKFWGDAVILDEGAELTWMRQPHYYNGLYSYTYSCSLVISTEMFRRLREEGESATQDWLKFLAQGGPTAPVDHAKTAKIDISNTKSLDRTINFMGEIVGKLEDLYA